MAASKQLDEDRWVERRAQYLASAEIGLRGPVAEAVAWSELGVSSSGISTRVDVGESTAKKYLDRAEEMYPGIIFRMAHEFDHDVEAGVDDLGNRGLRECPVCLKRRVASPEAASRVFHTSAWGATEMLGNADLVCSYCHSVRVDGQWDRMEQVGSRAYELSQSGSKSHSEYREILTRGIDADGGPAGEDRAADDAEELDW